MTLPRTLMLALAGLSGALAGCAGRDYPWYREGLTEAQLKQDMEECNAQAHSYGFLNPGLDAPGTAGGGPSGRVVVRDEADLFRACMNARGYARVPPPREPPGAASGDAE